MEYLNVLQICMIFALFFGLAFGFETTINYDIITTAANMNPSAARNQTVYDVSRDVSEIGKLHVKKIANPIWKRTDIGLISCVELCIDKDNCYEVNYQLDTQTCELLAPGTGSEIGQANSLYITNLTWTESMYKDERTCRKKPCADKERCVELAGPDYWCELKYCDIPEPKHGMTLSNSDTHIGASVQYACNSYLYHHYRMSSNITCQSNGLWTHVEHICNCNIPEPKNGMTLTHSNTNIGATVQYACNRYSYDQYRMSSAMTCQVSGLWTSIGQHYCQCGEPRSIHRASRSGSGRNIGDKVTYSCNTYYYKESGTKTIRCQSNGQWSHTDFQCKNGWKCSTKFMCIGATRNNNLPGCGSCVCCDRV